MTGGNKIAFEWLSPKKEERRYVRCEEVWCHLVDDDLLPLVQRLLYHVVVWTALGVLLVTFLLAVFPVLEDDVAQPVPPAAVEDLLLVAMRVVLAVLHHAQDTSVQYLGVALAAYCVKLPWVVVHHVAVLLSVDLLVALRRRVAQLEEAKHVPVVEDRNRDK